MVPESSENRFDWDRATELFQRFGVPAFDLVVKAGALDGIRPATAQRHFIALSRAMLTLAMQGMEPSAKALAEAGGPRADTTRKLLGCANLIDLPQATTRLMIDAGAAQMPERLVLDARTEPIAGPDKFGVIHPLPPPGIDKKHKRPGASNQPGGIANLYTLAACGPLALPMGEVTLMQGHWDPSNWRGIEDVEQRLREHADYGGPLTTTPESIVEELLERLAAAARLCAWKRDLDGAVITGGRLRCGFPVTREQDSRSEFEAYGRGSEDLYLGGSLNALRALHSAKMPMLLQLPAPHRSPHRSPTTTMSSCDWTIAFAGKNLPVAENIRDFNRRDSGWLLIDPDLVEPGDPTGAKYWRLTTPAMATAGHVTLKVTLLLRLSVRGELDVWVTADDFDDPGALKRVLSIAHAEVTERRPDGPVERTLRGLLQAGWAQRHKARRYPERRSFSALAQVTRALLELARC